MNIVSLKKLNHSEQPGPLSLIPLLKQTDNKILIGADHYSHLTELLSIKNEQIVKPDTIYFTTPSVRLSFYYYADTESKIGDQRIIFKINGKESELSSKTGNFMIPNIQRNDFGFAECELTLLDGKSSFISFEFGELHNIIIGYNPTLTYFGCSGYTTVKTDVISFLNCPNIKNIDFLTSNPAPMIKKIITKTGVYCDISNHNIII